MAHGLYSIFSVPSQLLCLPFHCGGWIPLENIFGLLWGRLAFDLPCHSPWPFPFFIFLPTMASACTLPCLPSQRPCSPCLPQHCTTKAQREKAWRGVCLMVMVVVVAVKKAIENLPLPLLSSVKYSGEGEGQGWRKAVRTGGTVGR